MLSLFTKKSESPAKVAKTVAAAEQRRDGLVKRLAAAETTVTERELAASNAALGDADDAALDKLESEVQNARQRVKTFADALAVAEREVAEGRDRFAQANDSAMRVETVGKVAAMATAVERAGAEIETALARLAEATGAAGAGLIVPESCGVQIFCDSAAAELNGAVAGVVALLKSYSRGVSERTLSPALPGQEAPTPKTKAVPVATMAIFPLKHLKWTEGGATRVTPKYFGITVPLHIGERAMSLGLAVATDSPRAKQLRHLSAARSVHPDDAISIDEVIDDVAQTSSPQPSEEPFEIIDRAAPTIGAPRLGTISVSRVA